MNACQLNWRLASQRLTNPELGPVNTYWIGATAVNLV